MEIIEMIWTLLGGACLVYWLFLTCVKADFGAVWLAAGMGFLCLSPMEQHLPHGAWSCLAAVLALGCLFFLAVEGCILKGMKQEDPGELDCLILLGAQVRGKTPSRALYRRIERAAGYLRAHPRTFAILSGGQGPGEEITEAQAMERALLQAGIERERLMKEESSTSTLENLRFSKKLLEGTQARVGIVTSRFHLFRALGLAQKLGYRGVVGLGASCEPVYLPHYLVREFFALLKEKLSGNL